MRAGTGRKANGAGLKDQFFFPCALCPVPYAIIHSLIIPVDPNRHLFELMGI
jgi:hypothetical protein